MRKVQRILPAAALLALVAAGCGGSARLDRTAARGLPSTLARVWSAQASAIANASASGDSCRAYHLATSLRDDVINQESRVPVRLQAPLVAGVNALADRITCTPSPPPKKHPPHDHHEHHHHHGDGGGGPGNQS
jgi:hypothetical protein